MLKNMKNARKQVLEKIIIDLYSCKGITLIPIPYWWDHTFESLNATLYRYKPDLFTSPPAGIFY